jgi:phosphoribosylamine--glycine ligase
MGAKVLVIGSGGREDALAWKLRQSPRVEEVFVVPAGGSIPALLAFAREHSIDLTVVGPDDILALGVVDAFREAGLKIFGPTKAAAEIEASKAFSKAFMARHGIPTAKFQTFTDHAAAKKYVEAEKLPIVIKASGLALGKGVIIAHTPAEAEDALQKMFIDGAFGAAANEVVIEEFLEGPEISIHVLSDGKDFAILPTSQDHKAVFDGGQGPNTGGMGTIAPLPWVSQEDMENIRAKIVEPALAGLAAEGRTFSGLLYPGLKMTTDGPKVLEFNARWGDPETQSYMRLLKSDAFEIFLACAEGRLAEQRIEWNEGAACCVILASGGYPEAYEKGKEIFGIEEAEKIAGVKVFRAGMIVKDGKPVTSGGRVLGVTATGENLAASLKTAYQAIAKISFEGMHYRKDIGAGALEADGK